MSPTPVRSRRHDTLLTSARRILTLLGAGQRSRWIAVVGLGLLATAFEAAGALVVFGLLARITTDDSGFELPVVGDLRSLLPTTDERTLMILIGSLIAAFFVLRAAVVIGQSYVQYRVAENAGARLSTRLLEGYLGMPYTFHLQRNSAELIRNAYDTVQQFVREALIPSVKLVSHTLIVAGLLGVLLATAPLATVMAVAVLGPFTVVLLRVLHPKVKGLGRRAQAMSQTTLQTLNESLAGWRDITVLGRQAAFVTRFAVDRRQLARARYLRSTARELPRISLETGLVLFVLALLGVVTMTQGGALEALPVLGMFGYAAIRIQPSLNEILTSLNSLKFASAGIDHIHADLALFSPTVPTAVEDPAPLRSALELEGVAVRYPDAVSDALVDVDLTVHRGEFLGIVGPTGGGKTTLVDVMLGILEPRAGRVLLDGVELSQIRERWHASVGVVHQTVFLADTTLRRNIALGLPDDVIDESAVRRAIHLAQLEDFVAGLPEGLDTVIGEGGVRVSGGQRQRLAIARALYRDPSTLFFDEGTSALDTGTEAQLMTALEGLRGERTIVAVAHRLTTVEGCDRVVLVDGGRIVDVAPFRALTERYPSLVRAG